LVDAHMHVGRLTTVSPAWRRWAEGFGDGATIEQVYDPDGAVVRAQRPCRGGPLPGRGDGRPDARRQRVAGVPAWPGPAVAAWATAGPGQAPASATPGPGLPLARWAPPVHPASRGTRPPRRD